MSDVRYGGEVAKLHRSSSKTNLDIATLRAPAGGSFGRGSAYRAKGFVLQLYVWLPLKTEALHVIRNLPRLVRAPYAVAVDIGQWQDIVAT